MKKLATWLLAAAFTTAALPAFAVEPSVQVATRLKEAPAFSS